MAIDDHSRVAFDSIEPDGRGISACRALMQAIRYYRGLDVRLECVPTDNDACYKSHSFRRLAASPARHAALAHATLYARPNGNAERLAHASLREWAGARSYANSDSVPSAFMPWLHHYNWASAPCSLGYNPPISRIPLDDVLAFTQPASGAGPSPDLAGYLRRASLRAMLLPWCESSKRTARKRAARCDLAPRGEIAALAHPSRRTWL